ncbi:MAG TPA: hydrogenase nickel incorporation protein HypB [Anaerolineales bacterium]|nr:hydrogenase nickel incorporation protein HypB [Anaerolineales bacterium]
MPDRVAVGQRILRANDDLAAANRAMLDSAGVFSVNLMASPGAGKTSLIERTVQALAGKFRLGVIDGDLATSLDADRAAAAGARAVQINTGGQCHLDAAMVSRGLDDLDLQSVDLLIVENVGNLVCPVDFVLGTHRNVLIASVPEGDDKPFKYPASYRGMNAVVLNKIDLLPHVRFDLKRFRHGVEVLNPDVDMFLVSCETGEGLPAWLGWLERKVEAFRLAPEAERDAG